MSTGGDNAKILKRIDCFNEISGVRKLRPCAVCQREATGRAPSLSIKPFVYRDFFDARVAARAL
jgi:hypothetical protein